MEHTCAIDTETYSIDITDFHDVGTQVANSAMLRVENSRIGSSFVIGPPEVNNIHNLTIPPCDIGVSEGNILTWLTFKDYFGVIFLKLRD